MKFNICNWALIWKKNTIWSEKWSWNKPKNLGKSLISRSLDVAHQEKHIEGKGIPVAYNFFFLDPTFLKNFTSYYWVGPFINYISTFLGATVWQMLDVNSILCTWPWAFLSASTFWIGFCQLNFYQKFPNFYGGENSDQWGQFDTLLGSLALSGAKNEYFSFFQRSCKVEGTGLENGDVSNSISNIFEYSIRTM